MSQLSDVTLSVKRRRSHLHGWDDVSLTTEMTISQVVPVQREGHAAIEKSGVVWLNVIETLGRMIAAIESEMERGASVSCTCRKPVWRSASFPV